MDARKISAFRLPLRSPFDIERVVIAYDMRDEMG